MESNRNNMAKTTAPGLVNAREIALISVGMGT
jgi:hypothetical protein